MVVSGTMGQYRLEGMKKNKQRHPFVSIVNSRCAATGSPAREALKKIVKTRFVRSLSGGSLAGALPLCLIKSSPHVRMHRVAHFLGKHDGETGVGEHR